MTIAFFRVTVSLSWLKYVHGLPSTASTDHLASVINSSSTATLLPNPLQLPLDHVMNHVGRFIQRYARRFRPHQVSHAPESAARSYE